MANIQLRFVTNGGATAITGSLTISDTNAARILTAERTYMATVDNQGTVDALVRRFLDEMIGDTKTIERNATVVPDISIT